MAEKANAEAAALGFRVKSGWASAVLLVGPASAPRLADCRKVELSDATVPESQQPYHATFGMLEEDRGKIQRRTDIARRAANESVAALIQECHSRDWRPVRAGLVVGSLIEPATISNPHIRAHALEGQLFRTVLAGALSAQQIDSSVFVERDAYDCAAKALKQPAAALKRAVTELGRSRSGPWRAEEKLAALAAWMILRGA
jgi:hypothetical protein